MTGPATPRSGKSGSNADASAEEPLNLRSTAFDEYEDSLEHRAGILRPPVTPGRDHIRGNPDAPLTLAEYGDFECPYCGMAYPIVRALEEALGDRVRFAFRHFPLANIHPHAVHAAEAAEAAGAQDRFWEMHDRLFEDQSALDLPQLIGHARALGLDVDRFVREIEDGAHAARVREDFLSGVRSGVRGTPTFFINGLRHVGPWDFENLLAALLQDTPATPAHA
jgi:Na+:H+ antiporter, NhaA family